VGENLTLALLIGYFDIYKKGGKVQIRMYVLLTSKYHVYHSLSYVNFLTQIYQWCYFFYFFTLPQFVEICRCSCYSV